jgi:ribosomal protein S27E
LTNTNPERGHEAPRVEVVEEDVIKNLMASIECDICGKYYNIDNVSILGHEEKLWFLRVSCSACNNQYLVAAMIKEDNPTETHIDPFEQEADRYSNEDVPTADEILDMHNFLKNFNGDFAQLFS